MNRGLRRNNIRGKIIDLKAVKLVYLKIKLVNRVVCLFHCSLSFMPWTLIEFTLTYKLNFVASYFDANMLLRKPRYWNIKYIRTTKAAISCFATNQRFSRRWKATIQTCSLFPQSMWAVFEKKNTLYCFLRTKKWSELYVRWIAYYFVV